MTTTLTKPEEATTSQQKPLNREGTFTVELTVGADKRRAHSSVRFDGNKAIITGKLRQYGNNFQFFAKDDMFFWPNEHMLNIKDATGKTLWENRSRR